MTLPVLIKKLRNIDNELIIIFIAEIYKSNVNIDHRFMWQFFRERESLYNTRKGAALFLPPTRSTTHRTNSAHFRDVLIWDQLPSSIKSSKLG